MKNDRSWAEPAEQQVAAALNGKKAPAHIITIATSIKSQIAKQFPNDEIVKAIWIGGEDYGNVGDVSVTTNNRSIPVELKFSLEEGRGTAKNLSAKLFQKTIDPSILSYIEYDKINGYKKERFTLLESITGKTYKKDNAYHADLRVMRDTNPVVLEQIADITAPGQEAYAKYVAKESNKRLDKVNKLVQTLLNKQVPGMLYCIIRQFETDNQSVEFMDFDKENKVVKVEASGKSIRCFNSKGKDVVRFSVHWKNICQGGKSPCFNVFIGNEYK
jgi:hypothetical protein